MIGFSTGALALGNLESGIKTALDSDCDAIELSILREKEFFNFIKIFNLVQDLIKPFKHVSVHLPSKLETITEKELLAFSFNNLPLVVHPDIIQDFSIWRALKEQVLIENMDKRKPIGQTKLHLNKIFNELPEAKLCFDIGHAYQIDKSMKEAGNILSSFQDRLSQIHISYVNDLNEHEPLNDICLEQFKPFISLKDVPIIIESPVRGNFVYDELNKVRKLISK